MDNNEMPGKMQGDIDAEIRTKGLTILARILAASVLRKNYQHCETDKGQDGQVDSSGRGESEPDTNDEAGDDH